MKKGLFLIILLAVFGLNDAIGQWTTNGNNIYNSNTGNVGIGNNAPTTLLHVGKMMTEPTITVQNLGGAGGATYTMMDQVSGANWKFKATNTGGFKIRDHANLLDVIVIEPNSAANALYINGAGYLGLGTAAPGAKLDVAGRIWQTSIGQSVFIGEGAGANDDLAIRQNVFVGYHSGYSNTQGWQNVAFGCYAFDSNIDGYKNTAIGDFALLSNIDGHQNTATGQDALLANTSGSYNVANGNMALYSNITGNSNVAIGMHALYNSTFGSNLVAIGDSALYNNYPMEMTGIENTAVGSKALYSNFDGSSNTAAGFQALYSSSYYSNNSAFGCKALWHHEGQYNTACGGEALKADGFSYNSAAFGYGALSQHASGDNNTAVGTYALGNDITGSNNTVVGCSADVTVGNLTNATAIGYQAMVNASNKIVLGNSSATTVGGYGAWSNYSDKRLKENILFKSDLGLDFIMKLHTVSYNYIDDSNKRRRDGLIAQDVQQILNELGLEFSGLIIDDDEMKTMNLSYSEFVIPLINATQELAKRLDAEQTKNEELTNQVNIMKAQIDAINNSLGISASK